VIIRVYIDPADKAQIERAAKAARRSVSSYVAIAATERAKADLAPTADGDRKAMRGAK
jgi:uncharacterized protein (DUF1778 family)